MPKILPYKNNDGYCSLYAIANAIEAALGIRATEQDIQDFFKRYDTGPKGMRVIEILTIMKREPWLGVKVESFRQPWHVKASFNIKEELRKCLRDFDYQIIFTLWARDKKKWFKLDKDHYYRPDKTVLRDATRAHAVFLQKMHTLPQTLRKFTRCTFLNNASVNWGDEGYFHMDWEDIETECMHITAVKFTYAPEV